MHTKKHLTKRHRKQKRQSRKYKNIGGMWPFDKTPSLEEQQKQQQQEQQQQNLYVFMTDKISIQSIPSDYKQIGIIHISDSSGISALRQIGTNLANTFGSKGFDNTVYDQLRNKVLSKLQKMVESTNNKVFNVRLDVESSGPSSATIFVHLYGDLCEPLRTSKEEQIMFQENVEPQNVMPPNVMPPNVIPPNLERPSGLN